ncbi:uncharacterized protein LOC110887328 [Helianthus annuus]|uniref:uncharacterized protein LOC110887328 n=1 Tax=Helianthus annuus TaxID=4232 RepID=UPI000B901653|nr:uncharacterized protein LOC110887328 [Helianthus annuus]
MLSHIIFYLNLHLMKMKMHLLRVELLKILNLFLHSFQELKFCSLKTRTWTILPQICIQTALMMMTMVFRIVFTQSCYPQVFTWTRNFCNTSFYFFCLRFYMYIKFKIFVV